MEAFLIVMTGRTATGLLLIEAWVAAKPLTLHKTATTAKKDLAQNINGMEFEKLCSG